MVVVVGSNVLHRSWTSLGRHQFLFTVDYCELKRSAEKIALYLLPSCISKDLAARDTLHMESRKTGVPQYNTEEEEEDLPAHKIKLK